MLLPTGLAPPRLALALRAASAEQSADASGGDDVRTFVVPEVGLNASSALDVLRALEDAASHSLALLFVSHLDALGDRGGVIVEGPRCPTGAVPALDVEEERAYLAREAAHIRHRLQHADRLTARAHRVREQLLAAKAPTRGASYREALDAELEREGRELDAAILDARALTRGFRTARGYAAALGETLLAARKQPTLSVRLPPLGAALDASFDATLDGASIKSVAHDVIEGGASAADAALNEHWALERVYERIQKGARRTTLSPQTRCEMLPIDVAVDALVAARSQLLNAPPSAPSVVTALATSAPPAAPKPAASRLLTVERFLELVDLAARSTEDKTPAHPMAAAAQLLESRVLASADLAPASRTLAQAPGLARKGFSFAGALAKTASRRTLGARATGLAPLVDTGVTQATAAVSRVFGDGRDPFVEPVQESADEDASTRAATLKATASKARLCSGLVTSGQRIRAQRLAEAPTPFAPAIDWRRYLLDRHLPALEERRRQRLEKAREREAMPAFDTLVDLVTEVSLREKNRPAFTRFTRTEDGSEMPETLDYRALLPRAKAIAARLIAAGVAVGDRVVLSGDNHPDWALCAFGTFFAGATLVPLDPGLDEDQAQVILRKARARLAILDAHAHEQFGSLVDETAEDYSGALQSVRVIDLHLAAKEGPRQLGDEVEQELLERAPRADAIASILFTSGTTGEPKGVELSHQNFTRLLASLGAVFDMHKGDRSLSLMPMHHTLEFSCGLLLPLAAGAHIHYLDALTADRLAYGLKAGRITGMVGVPALWQLLERKMRSRIDELDPRLQQAFSLALKANRFAQATFGQDFGRLVFKPLHDELGGHLRTLISGGAALPPDVHAFFAGIGLHLAEGYGLTESAPVLTVAGGGPGVKPGTVGRPIPGVSIRIEDPDPSGVGEVWAKGPNIMRGYFENKDATAATLSEDGWLRTGDLGRLDNGVLTLVGRAKDVVVTASGENIYLDDTEARIGPIAGVAEQTLLGVDDPRGGERLAFAYVLEDGADTSATEAAVKKALNKLPETFRPQVVVIVEGPLPKTATRKVKRKDVVPLVEAVLAAKSESAPAEGPALSAVRGAIAAASGDDVKTLTAATDLRADLGFDSLLWVEVQDALEPIYGAIDADALFACQTIGDVEQLLRQQGDASRGGGAASSERLCVGPARSSGDDERTRIPAPFVPTLRKALSVAQRDLYRTLFETDVNGRAYIPHNRPTIVVANHTSHLDVGLVKFALGRYGQKLAPLAAKDYFFEGAPLKVAVVEQLTNLVAIERESGSGVAFEQAKEAVNQGQVVLIFPEGTRRAEGTLGDFKPLVGRLSLTCGVDVLPLYLDGAFEALPRGSYRPRARQLRARIGPPLSSDVMASLTAHLSGAEAARTATGYIRDAVAALRDGHILQLTKDGALSREAPDAAPASSADAR